MGKIDTPRMDALVQKCKEIIEEVERATGTETIDLKWALGMVERNMKYGVQFLVSFFEEDPNLWFFIVAQEHLETDLSPLAVHYATVSEKVMERIFGNDWYKQVYGGL